MLWGELADGGCFLWDSSPCTTEMNSAHQVDGRVTGLGAIGCDHDCCCSRQSVGPSEAPVHLRHLSI